MIEYMALNFQILARFLKLSSTTRLVNIEKIKSRYWSFSMVKGQSYY